MNIRAISILGIVLLSGCYESTTLKYGSGSTSTYTTSRITGNVEVCISQFGKGHIETFCYDLEDEPKIINSGKMLNKLRDEAELHENILKSFKGGRTN